MHRIVLVAALVAGSAGCLSDSLSLRISDAPGTLDEPAHEWSQSAGSVGLYPPGTLTFPQAHVLKLELVRLMDTAEREEAIAFGSVEVVDGSSCRLTRAARCIGTACVAELEIMRAGTCMVRARTATPDGEERDLCWYRAVFEQDPADPDQLDRLGAIIEAEAEACTDGL